MLTEKDYCDYDTCVVLLELGFDEKCHGYYELLNRCFNRTSVKHSWRNSQVSDFAVICPTLYEAQKWLREEKEVYVTVIPEYNEFGPIKGVKYRLEVAYWKDDEFGYETIEWLDEECPHTIITFDSYEEALSEGIKEAIKILKENGYGKDI